MITYEPLYDLVLLKPLPLEGRTKTGLYIPQLATDNTPYVKCEVMAVGHGRPIASGALVPLTVQVGDVVLAMRTGKNGDQAWFPAEDGTEWLLCREVDVRVRLHGLDKVTSIVGVDGGNLELPS
jgi:co-chaperonin GroES (HSP10)